MKKMIACSTAIVILVTTVCSCSKQVINRNTVNQTEVAPPLETSAAQIINTEITSGKTYSLDFTAPATATIVKQASHFRLSEIDSQNGDGSMSYKYTPTDGYKGSDEVTISYSSPETPGYTGCPAGAQHNNGYKYLTIKMNVIN